MAVRKKLIREVVDGILVKHKIKQAPIPIDEIVRSLKIEVKVDEVDNDLSGFLFRDSDEKRVVIGTNKKHHPNRQRFTLAHELAHFYLHDGERVHLDQGRLAFKINRRDTRSSSGEDDEEREANYFAAELLMPEKLLSKDLQWVDLDLLDEEGGKILQSLAKKYAVSIQALTFRLANLGYIEL